MKNYQFTPQTFNLTANNARYCQNLKMMNERDEIESQPKSLEIILEVTDANSRLARHIGIRYRRLIYIEDYNSMYLNNCMNSTIMYVPFKF